MSGAVTVGWPTLIRWTLTAWAGAILVLCILAFTGVMDALFL